MNAIADFQKRFAYNDWANKETLRSIDEAAGAPDRAIQRMGHIIGAEWLWIGRLKEETSDVRVWPDLTTEGCADWMRHLPRAWQEILVGLTPAGLVRPVAYTNTRGESCRDEAKEILDHVLLHSAYHRGQIAADLAAAGESPAYTDSIHFARQGFIRPG